ncbi:MAG: 50S ribosomal protein L32e, partial [Thermoplasmata archaeon]
SDAEVRVPKRADLTPPMRTLLSVRRSIDRRRPIFGRQAANRYYRIGRDGSWRRPRGLQSKQRRHYGYRAQIVSIGYRSPARVRGLVPSGFFPVIVHTAKELDGIDARRQAAIIARTVGTRRRLVLEEQARKLGIRVLNPIVSGDSEA